MPARVLLINESIIADKQRNMPDWRHLVNMDEYLRSVGILKNQLINWQESWKTLES